jgi:UDP-2-acetamido-3-amino-2,3-dideoxy-glucuronate N-acetyltransferase
MAISNANIHSSADIADSARIAATSRIWHYAQVREGAVIGENCVVGRGAYVGTGVEVGNNCKIQNYALVYEPAKLAAGVFVGPAVVFTNDQFPRAVNPDGTPKSAHDWIPVGVTVLEGASIGAQSVCVAPLTIGAWSLVGSGSTVVKDVPDFAIVVGNPARRIGWVGKAGHPLIEQANSEWLCPSTTRRFIQTGPDTLIEAENS